ncbi:MAG: stage II sporulation protein M [Gemmatimonadota bacterium]|nr:stage II sporulation protein M [Gemmatimonadota bacterium]
MPAPQGVPATRPLGALEQVVEVETPEQVVFAYTVAGVGSRAAAALLDYLLCFGILFTLFLIFATIARFVSHENGAARFIDRWMFAVLVFMQFVVMWGYYVVFETMWDGQTPGKRRVGIRVVQDGGYSVSFAASAVRNLTRIIDMQPGLIYAVGIISSAISKSGKRLGDHIAGTFVVHEGIRDVGMPATAAPGAVVSAGPSQPTAALTDAEYELLGRFLVRRNQLEADRRAQMGGQLIERFAGRLGSDGTDLARLAQLYESERAARARGVAAKGTQGAAREQHLIVARGAARWSAFAALLADAQNRGLRALSEKEVSVFVAEYRELATDLARLKTASRGREPDALFYVSRLVGAGHNLLYRQRRLPMKAIWRYMAFTVPFEIRRSVLPILAAAFALFAPAFVAYRAIVANPELAYEMIPPGMIDRAEQATVRAKTGAGYVDIGEFERPVVASSIIANNVQVTYAAFAFGITGGILTLFLLVNNGISLGAALGLFASKGVATVLLEFIAPHGVLELTAICIAGGGGLLLAKAILLPGAFTRREALVRNGRRAIRLIAGSTFLLLIAGSIEGMISPKRDWPIEWKLAVSLATALFLIFYITRGRGRQPEFEEESAYS